MSANEGIPCRVSADLRQYQAKLDKQDERRFDPWDDALMDELFGARLAGPLSALLIALEQIEKTEQSFGPDKAKAFDFIRPYIAALKDGCQKEFEQL
jgi:hypothetical protein